jgi:hypothetical protein
MLDEHVLIARPARRCRRRLDGGDDAGRVTRDWRREGRDGERRRDAGCGRHDHRVLLEVIHEPASADCWSPQDVEPPEAC